MEKTEVGKSINKSAENVWKIISQFSGIENFVPAIVNSVTKGNGKGMERTCTLGNGASFDNAILRYAYRQCGKNLGPDSGPGVKFWNDRDMRTIVGFYPRQLQEKWRRTVLRKGDHHNALDDAKHQVRYCSDILKELGVNELY